MRPEMQTLNWCFQNVSFEDEKFTFACSVKHPLKKKKKSKPRQDQSRVNVDKAHGGSFSFWTKIFLGDVCAAAAGAGFWLEKKKKKKKHLGFCDVGFLPVTATGTIKAQNSDEMMQNCRLTESVYPCSFNCQIQADSPACVSQNQLNLKFG